MLAASWWNLCCTMLHHLPVFPGVAHGRSSGSSRRLCAKVAVVRPAEQLLHISAAPGIAGRSTWSYAPKNLEIGYIEIHCNSAVLGDTWLHPSRVCCLIQNHCELIRWDSARDDNSLSEEPTASKRERPSNSCWMFISKLQQTELQSPERQQTSAALLVVHDSFP